MTEHETLHPLRLGFLLHDFNGTHDLILPAIFHASKPAHSRQLRRQLAGRRGRRMTVPVTRGFRIEMFQFLAFANEAGAVENDDERASDVQDSRRHGADEAE